MLQLIDIGIVYKTVEYRVSISVDATCTVEHLFNFSLVAENLEIDR